MYLRGIETGFRLLDRLARERVPNVPKRNRDEEMATIVFVNSIVPNVPKRNRDFNDRKMTVNDFKCLMYLRGIETVVHFIFEIIVDVCLMYLRGIETRLPTKLNKSSILVPNVPKRNRDPLL